MDGKVAEGRATLRSRQEVPARKAGGQPGWVSERGWPPSGATEMATLVFWPQMPPPRHACGSAPGLLCGQGSSNYKGNGCRDRIFQEIIFWQTPWTERAGHTQLGAVAVTLCVSPSSVTHRPGSTASLVSTCFSPPPISPAPLILPTWWRQTSSAQFN